MGKLFCEESKRLFPLNKIDKLVQLFKNEFIQKSEAEAGDGGEPNLALASIILGAIEHSLTSTPTAVASATTATLPTTKGMAGSTSTLGLGQSTPEKFNLQKVENEFPPLEFDIVVALYDKFKSSIKRNVNSDLLSKSKSEGTSRELVKNISDVIWNSLSRSYQTDKPHLQSLYTYLTGNKLDCFGLALGVVAGAQVLGLTDVHLALSEDHGWVVFGRNGELNAEVTWHGKGNEDRRGQPIDEKQPGGETTHSWLYLKGHPVICTRNTEIAAIVSGINPSISGSCDSTEMGLIQQKLLWALYDAGTLARYPMAIGNLADLEEISPTLGRKSCVELFREAITCNKLYYSNMHVYPYTYFAGYLYRQERWRETLKYWAEASQAISNYRYSKFDEEVYKEFLEITTDQLTFIMKQCSTGINANALTRDPAAFAHLLQFFDGICTWEEYSATPVLHIVWAKAWIGAITKFEYSARVAIKIITAEDSTEAGVDLNGNTSDKEATVILRSFKMKGVIDLLQREKLNPPALTLQLTAQPTLGVSSFGKNGAETGGGGATAGGGRIRKIKSQDGPLNNTEGSQQSRAKRARK